MRSSRGPRTDIESDFFCLMKDLLQFMSCSVLAVDVQG